MDIYHIYHFITLALHLAKHFSILFHLRKSTAHTSTGASVATRFCCAWKTDGGQLERRCEAGRVKKKVMKRETAQRGVCLGLDSERFPSATRQKKNGGMVHERYPKQQFGIVLNLFDVP